MGVGFIVPTASRFFVAALVAAVCACSSSAENVAFEPNAADVQPVETDRFPGGLAVLEVLSSQTLLCMTIDGWYWGNLETGHWRRFLSHDEGEAGGTEWAFVGGEPSGVWFVSQANRGTALVRLSDGGRTRQVVLEQVGAAQFYNAEIGVATLADGEVKLTTDSGEQWLMLEAPFEDGEAVAWLRFVSDTYLVVSGQRGSLAFVQVSDGSVLWHVRDLYTAGPFAELSSGLLWVVSHDGLHGLRLEDGADHAHHAVEEPLEAIFVDDSFFVLYARDYLRTFVIDDAEWRLVSDVVLRDEDGPVSQYLFRSLTAGMGEDGERRLYVTDDSGRLGVWGPLDELDAVEPTWQPLVIENGLAVELHEQERRDAELQALFREWGRLIQLVPDSVLEDLGQQADAMEEKTAAERIAWMIEQMQAYLRAQERVE